MDLASVQVALTVRTWLDATAQLQTQECDAERNPGKAAPSERGCSSGSPSSGERAAAFTRRSTRCIIVPNGATSAERQSDDARGDSGSHACGHRVRDDRGFGATRGPAADDTERTGGYATAVRPAGGCSDRNDAGSTGPAARNPARSVTIRPANAGTDPGSTRRMPAGGECTGTARQRARHPPAQLFCDQDADGRQTHGLSQAGQGQRPGPIELSQLRASVHERQSLTSPYAHRAGREQLRQSP
jgi:hypothetical protein